MTDPHHDPAGRLWAEMESAPGSDGAEHWHYSRRGDADRAPLTLGYFLAAAVIFLAGSIAYALLAPLVALRHLLSKGSRP